MRSFLAAACTALFLLATPNAAAQTCSGGSVTEDATGTVFECGSVDLLARISPQSLGAPTFSQCPLRTCANDLWGWTDATTGREYAIVGLANGTAFVDVTNPGAPVRLGRLPTATSNSTWRDVKVHADHAYIVSEAGDHGMQVFDLTRLRGLSEDGARTFTADARIGSFSSHNVVVDTESARAYSVGGRCGGGLDIYDLSDPAAPVSLGCYSGGGYVHDAQCVTYDGPDTDYTGRQICFGYNADRIVIMDATDGAAVTTISNAFYPSPRYTHQGWMTEDGRHLIVNDEADEDFGGPTRTIVMEVADLDSPEFAFFYLHDTNTVDHNLYVRGRYAYEANYNNGLRILDLAGIDGGSLSLAAHFKTFAGSPDGVRDDFDGAWSVYPFFESGTLIVSDQIYGLFTLRASGLETAGEHPPSSPTLRLDAPEPNPSTAQTSIRLHPSESGARVRVVVTDALGREVAVLRDGPLGAATDLVIATRDLPAGLYLVRAESEGETATASFSVVR